MHTYGMDQAEEVLKVSPRAQRALQDAALALNVSSRSLADRRWRLRVVLVGHRAREDLCVGVASRRNAVDGSLGNCYELHALFVDIDSKMTPES